MPKEGKIVGEKTYFTDTVTIDAALVIDDVDAMIDGKIIKTRKRAIETALIKYFELVKRIEEGVALA